MIPVTTPTTEDINRNFNLMEAGKALDMPLIVLGDRLKEKVYRGCLEYKTAQRKHQQTSVKYKKYQRVYHKKYYRAKKIKKRVKEDISYNKLNPLQQV